MCCGDIQQTTNEYSSSDYISVSTDVDPEDNKYIIHEDSTLLIQHKT